MKKLHVNRFWCALLGLGLGAWLAPVAEAQSVTYKPYIELGDAGSFGPSDQMVVAWQTDEASPNPTAYAVEFGTTTAYGTSVTPAGRVVNNYLAADSTLPPPPAAPGPHSDYSAVLKNLAYDTTYFYRVTGPGMPAGGFTASFHARKQSDHFSFLVQGDEGFFPPEPNTNPPRLADYEARIVHLMYNAQNLWVPGAPQLQHPDIALNTGDNVYNNGAEGSYRDYWMPVWNSDTDSNETGAPFIRSIPFFIVVGNHDTGATGVNVNMLGGDGGRFTGGTDGGDAMAYFNNYYFPLNGPVGVDQEFTWTGDSVADNGMLFSFAGKSYTSPAAIKAYRDSTTVDSGGGTKRQIDHMSNYSFDYGNAHFVFIEANPHVFAGLLDGSAVYAKAPPAFSPYPSILRQWLINDLDSSSQTWKFVVFHQPAFSSGNATVKNSQMRGVAKFLEDHGVNVVFNGHEHNYQRTLPLRAEAAVGAAPNPAGPAAVDIDTSFDGITQTVPDGVLYIVEGSGGNREFDGDKNQPRGQGPGVDQDESATGTFTLPNTSLTFVNGPAAWLDTHLTDNEMSPVLPGAGTGPKITTRFKSKVFSFGDVLVRGNKLTLYQISEPLQPTSSATAANPAPFGTDVNGVPLNDPIPDTLVDPTTGNVVTPSAVGQSVLLDKFTVTKPDLGDNQDGNAQGGLTANLSAPSQAIAGSTITYSLRVQNDSSYALNGTQVVVSLPAGASFAGTTSDTLTVHGSQVVVTLARLAAGAGQAVQVPATLASGLADGTLLRASAAVRSSTALPVSSNSAVTSIGQNGQNGQN